MLARKLTTLAGAAGILGLGACFLPPPPPRQLPPPPLARRDLQDIRQVFVVVEGAPPSRYFNPPAAAEAVTDGINLRSRNSKVKASAYAQARGANAILKITILNETAVAIPSAQPADFQNWSIHVVYSTTLTNSDGQILWQEDHFEQTFRHRLRTDDPADFWKEYPVQYSMMSNLGSDLALRLFYVD